MAWRKKEEVQIQQPNEEEDLNQKIEFLKQKVKDLEANGLQTPKVIPQINTQKKRTEVVRELPVQPIRSYKDEEGNIVELMTIEEALNLIVNS